jgi:mRNA interferase MazF
MRVKRGDIVLVDYPFTTGGAKVRPALVVQNDRDNARMTNTIVAQISGNTARVNEATQHLIELTAEPNCGLARDSALIATNLLTMQQSDILRVLGSLSAATMAQIDNCLEIALGLP